MIEDRSFTNKVIALPQDHGSWVFLFGPLVLGWIFAEKVTVEMAALSIASIAFFLMRQPLAIFVKVMSGRRAEKDRNASVFWTMIYGVIGVSGFAYLIFAGLKVVVLLLVIPGSVMLGYQLLQVYRRNERKQKNFEMISTGLLAATAPLLLFIARGSFDISDLFLWLLLWFQSAASIEYAFSRLQQRTWKEMPDSKERIQNGMDALIKTALNLIFVYLLIQRDVVGENLWVAFLPQFVEVVLSIWKPALNAKPVAIGVRQLGVSISFLLLFMFLW